MEYHYIIVGGGSAGCVLANRLSAQGNRQVLLLEAGGRDNHPLIRIPAAFYRLYKSKVDYGFYTEPQPHAHNRQLFVPRGKTLGGSGSINAMIYIRGHATDYDKWAAAGNVGWDYSSVLPYFLRAENNANFGAPYHSQSGPWHISNLLQPHPLSLQYLQAGHASGLPFLADMNGAADEGVGIHQVNQRGGKRHSPADAYLHPIKNRPNLHLRTGAQVQKILFTNKRATGLMLVCGKQQEEVRCSGEIILCAGSIHSPLILQRSGIGDAAMLGKLGMKALHHLPGVGQNLHDHPVVPLIYRTKKSASLDSAETLPNLLQWIFKKTGPFTSNLAEGGGFLRTEPQLDAPDIQLHFAPAFFVNHGFSKPKGNGMSLAPILLRPASRGTVKPHPGNPFQPLINPQVFAQSNDLHRLREGFKRAVEIMQAKPMDPWRETAFLPQNPLKTNEEIEQYIRQNVELLYHPVGSCKMGSDNQAVVNAQLQVHGLEGLRIADASIMPQIVSGNTQAATIMIAEKAAEMLGDL
ncbi:MAG: GMC family oxidoreductase [Bacteroidia bacterium]